MFYNEIVVKDNCLDKLTLWEVTESVSEQATVVREAESRVVEKRVVSGPAVVDEVEKKPRKKKMQEIYDELVLRMKSEHRLRVRKWRKSSSGCAWRVFYESGTVSNLIESPYPRGPMSVSIFLHEVGHHAIGFNTYSLRCLEEYKAWEWSLRKMHAENLNITTNVLKRVDLSLRYAVSKAVRRRLKRLPVELLPFMHGKVLDHDNYAAVRHMYDSSVEIDMEKALAAAPLVVKRPGLIEQLKKMMVGS